MGTRRLFSREFKLEAVRLVKDRGVSVAQAARDLDVHENVLRKWVRMSGSPLWLQQGVDLKCAGILIEHHRSKKLLVATDIAVGLHLVESAAERFP
jgi:hypothetical protein